MMLRVAVVVVFSVLVGAGLVFVAKAETAAGVSLAKATFARGCFWCMEPLFDALPASPR